SEIGGEPLKSYALYDRFDQYQEYVEDYFNVHLDFSLDKLNNESGFTKITKYIIMISKRALLLIGFKCLLF
ncbi:MAG TPA: hypothetical protein VKQ08_12355, partial [Cyclobacteriaceae bacterium]|nr:hypothetical protein [Cyclobacteriaceae bacterium]